MSKKPPLVSVIVPCYNHEKYVEETIESIVNQTYKNIELIVIDDGSKDASPQIIHKLSKKYNFKFIHRPNRGLSATLNECIELSKGKYVSVCASDDKLKLDKVEKQVKFMENNLHYGMCYGKVILFEDNGNETPLEIKHSRGGWIFDDLIVNQFHIPAVSNMIRKSVFQDVGVFDENLWVEDWDMWLRIANKYQIGYLDEYLAYYRQHETNISKQGWKMYEAKVSALKKWKELDNYDQIMKIWQLKWFRALSRDYKSEAKKYLPVALKNIFNINSIIGIVKYFFMSRKQLRKVIEK